MQNVLSEHLKHCQQHNVQTARDAYRDIIYRSEIPRKDDAKKLNELILSIGMSPDDVANDIDSLATYRRYSAKAAKESSHRAVLRELSAEHRAAQCMSQGTVADQCKRKAALIKISKYIARCQGLLIQATNAREQMEVLRVNNWFLPRKEICS